MAVCRPVRPANAGAIDTGRGARNGSQAGVRGTTQHTMSGRLKKAAMLEDFDRAGLTAAFMEPEDGGFHFGAEKTSLWH